MCFPLWSSPTHPVSTDDTPPSRSNSALLGYSRGRNSLPLFSWAESRTRQVHLTYRRAPPPPKIVSSPPEIAAMGRLRPLLLWPPPRSSTGVAVLDKPKRSAAAWATADADRLGKAAVGKEGERVTELVVLEPLPLPLPPPLPPPRRLVWIAVVRYVEMITHPRHRKRTEKKRK